MTPSSDEIASSAPHGRILAMTSMPSHIPLHVVAVFGIVQRGDRYLISRRSLTDDQEPGAWFFPGGKVEEDAMGFDVVEQCLHRELMEEVGVMIGERIRMISSQGFTRSSGHHVISMVYICDWVAGEGQPLEDQAEIRWCTIAEMHTLPLPHYTKELVRRLAAVE